MLKESSVSVRPLKCALLSAPKDSINFGAASTNACISGFLVSRIRNGLLSNRR
ncbi:hypothetical protein BMETH_2408_0 [methanotrophic bacterial endosymbiont of Bathymodiolus sp.]|nr:hypothetical protein BMETH_2408_0 [methanotrophic bacterial endosymbiont of Bathymodiolus sp.]